MGHVAVGGWQGVCSDIFSEFPVEGKCNKVERIAWYGCGWLVSHVVAVGG